MGLGLCLVGSPSGGGGWSLSGGLCPGGSLSGGLCLGGPGVRGLCPWGLCLGVSGQEGSLSRGSLSRRGLCHGDPLTVMSGNAFFLKLKRHNPYSSQPYTTTYASI